jgi:hypothetical protein
MCIQGNGGGLDGDTSLLLVLSRIRKPTAILVIIFQLISRRGITHASPALAAEIIPARWTRESVKVDFPWSTAVCISPYCPLEGIQLTYRVQ